MTPTASSATRELSRPMWYLACPYSHDDASVREARFKAICTVAGVYVQQGISVFSPIAHTHAIEQAMGVGKIEPPVWIDFDQPMMEASCGIITVTFPSWEASVGVGHEEDYFRDTGRPVLRDHSWQGIIPPELMRDLMVPAMPVPGEVSWLPDESIQIRQREPGEYCPMTGTFEPAD